MIVLSGAALVLPDRILTPGTLTIDGDRISAVEPAGSRSVDVDLGDVAILPGLVNAHTHLDLTGMRGLLSKSGRNGQRLLKFRFQIRNRPRRCPKLRSIAELRGHGR